MRGPAFLGFLLLTAPVAACASPSASRAPTVVIVPGPPAETSQDPFARLAEPSTESNAEFWTLEDAGCPRGARLTGAAPPDDFEVHCERPDGTRHGPSASFYEEGSLYLRSEYVDGRLHGRVIALYPNGVRWMLTDYRAGKRVRIRAFWRNGAPASLTEYRNELRHGGVLEWDERGRLRRIEEYEAGEPHGVHESYDAAGSLVERARYEHGGLVSHWQSPAAPSASQVAP
jgi:hypothetical protein